MGPPNESPQAVQPARSPFVAEAQRAAGIGAMLLAVGAAAGLYLGGRRWVADGEAFLAVPVLYALAVVGAAQVAFLLWLRARVIDSEQLRWVAWGFALAGAAALIQGLSVAGVAHRDPLSLSETSAAGMYLLWHVALATFSLGAVAFPTWRKLRVALVGGFGALIAASLWDPLWLPAPRLVDDAGAFTSAYRWVLATVLVYSVVATAAWLWRTGRRPTRPQAWISVALVLACLDMIVAAGATRFFEALWWSSAALRTAQFAVPAGGLLADMARLVVLLRHHEQRLAEQLHQELETSRPDERRTAKERDAIAKTIHSVLTRRDFVLHYQPIYGLDSGRLLAVEALTRFNREPYRPPNEWFADAERVGLAADLELAVIYTAVDSLTELPQCAGLTINASPAVLPDPRLQAVLDRIPPGRLIFEITEHAIIEDYDIVERALAPLRAAGVRLAVDDAGAGFASLRHIVRLSPDIIKLDRSLTHSLHTDPVRGALADALVSFANRTATLLIAEGVEQRDELTAWQLRGAHAAQGYFLARPGPLPVSETTPLIKASASTTARPGHY